MASSAESLERRVGRRLTELGCMVATAESCSGGLVAHRITNVPGASTYFVGGVVAYSNEVKTALLGVSAADLSAHGAVSEPVARQMAEGARKRFAAEFGIGITGIAGPDGGSRDKPVGLVYVAVAGPKGAVVRRNVFEGSRVEIKEHTADGALSLLLECLK